MQDNSSIKGKTNSLQIVLGFDQPREQQLVRDHDCQLKGTVLYFDVMARGRELLLRRHGLQDDFFEDLPLLYVDAKDEELCV